MQLSHYLKHEIHLADHPQLALDQRYSFVGIDLAPNNQLESGITVIDRDRTLLRMDKLYADDDILAYLKALGPANSLIIAIDMPKNLNIKGKFLQEEIKLHPLRLSLPHHQQHAEQRFGARGFRLWQHLWDMQALPFLFFSYGAKLQFDLTTPYRGRSPQGCRALQAAIKHHLELRNMPSNLAPSSVLDAMVGAYCAWLLWIGQESQHYRLFLDTDGRLLFRAKQRFDWVSLSQRPDWIPH
jgi:hypothetical protein